MRRQRRTKIVATLGPATDSEAKLAELMQAGVDLFRLNFSHGTPEEHQQRAARIRAISAQLGREVAILGDLQGPKIRIRGFESGSVILSQGAAFALDTALDAALGTEQVVGVDLDSLPRSVAAGDVLILDDGRIRLQVTAIEGTRVHCTVIQGGKLSNRKGLNKLGGGLSAPALTERDLADIKRAAALGLDYLAVSFPLSAADIVQTRTLATAAGSRAAIVAKIERAEVVQDEAVLDAIIAASDAIMVARGDLGVEIGDAQLMGAQKQLINKARAACRTVITATQMMESMTQSPIPTRAEVFDVANAVLDGSDAVMLSAETATGDYPVETVRAMADACIGAEDYPEVYRDNRNALDSFERVDEGIAMAAVYTANRLHNVAGMVCLTESGTTALRMSRISSSLPIYALSRHPEVVRKMSLYRGVIPIVFDYTVFPAEQVANEAIRAVMRLGYATPGERLVLTRGDLLGVGGSTTTLKILEALEETK